jgi:hypothetical protein
VKEYVFIINVGVRNILKLINVIENGIKIKKLTE